MGCATPEPKSPLSYSANAKKAYEEAMVQFDDHSWPEAEALLREVKKKYTYSRFARLAELRLADADFEQEKYAEAIQAYKQFIHDHRSESEDVAYARSKMAEAQYSQISDSLLLPPGEERDQATVVDAHRELRNYLRDYPGAVESERIRKLLSEVTGRLIRHELYVARFYLDRDNYDAVVARVHYALRNFALGLASQVVANEPAANGAEPDNVPPGAVLELNDDLALEAEALILLGETYLKMNNWRNARIAFEVVAKGYPLSGLVLQARNYLDTMNRRGV